MKYEKVLPLLCISVFLTLSGCGGGGGSDDPEVTDPTNPPQNDSAVTAENGEDFITVAISATEGMLQLGQASVDAVNAFISDGHISTTITCSNSGTMLVDYDDADNSNNVSAGDTVTIDYMYCFDSAINDTPDGQVVLKIQQTNSYTDKLETLTAEIEYGEGFYIDTSEGEIDVSGGFLLQYSMLGNSAQIVAESNAAQPSITLDLAGTRETYRELEVQQSLPGDGSYEVEVQLASESELFDTSYSCTAFELLGPVNSAPEEGTLSCEAEDGSSVRITADTSLLEIDTDADGSFETSTNSSVLADSVEGYLFGDNPY